MGMAFNRFNNKTYTFLFYLLIGDVVMFVFWHMFNSNFASRPIVDASPYPEDKNDKKLESVEQTVSDKDSVSNSEVECITADSLPPMTYWENFRAQYGIYIGLFACYFTTLLIFPVLVFRVGISISTEYKYLLFTFLFNAGDVIGRIGYDLSQTTNRYLIHALSIIKVLFIPLFYALSKNPNLITQEWIRGAVIFMFAFVHGFICTGYFNISTNEFSQKLDRYRAGNLSSMALIIGLTIGGISSFIW